VLTTFEPHVAREGVAVGLFFRDLEGGGTVMGGRGGYACESGEDYVEGSQGAGFEVSGEGRRNRDGTGQVGVLQFEDVSRVVVCLDVALASGVLDGHWTPRLSTLRGRA